MLSFAVKTVQAACLTGDPEVDLHWGMKTVRLTLKLDVIPYNGPISQMIKRGTIFFLQI